MICCGENLFLSERRMDPIIQETPIILSSRERFYAGFQTYANALTSEEALVEKELLQREIQNFSTEEIYQFSEELFVSKREYLGVQKLRLIETYALLRNLASSRRFDDFSRSIGNFAFEA